jgi:hypothetical protein
VAALRAADSLAEVRSLYASAAYEETLALLTQVNDPALQDAADARRLVADAESQTQQADEERRELAGIQTQLQAQLDDARTQARDAGAQVASLQEELTEARREAEARSRELQTFRRRLEQAVHDAEERSRAQDAERERLEHDLAEASARAAAAMQDRNATKQQLAHASSELERLRPQVEVAAARIASLEQDLLDRGQVIESLQQAQQAARLAMVEAPVAISAQAAPHVPAAVSSELPSTDDVATTEVVVASPHAEEGAQSAHSEAMQWLHTLGGPVQATEPVAADPLAAESSVGIETVDDVPADDPPISPESTGVFSTVADALRAWTTETDAPREQGTGPEMAPVSVSAADANAEGASARPDVPQYDIVRQTVRFDLATRRIQVTIDAEPGQLVELSSGGAQVVTSSVLKPGRQVRLAFPAAGPLATARAEIVWSRLEPPTHGGGELLYRAGLTFVKTDVKTIERVIGAASA